MDEKWVTIEIGGYRRRCPESRLEQILAEVEQMKREYLQKGAPKQVVDEMYRVVILPQ